MSTNKASKVRKNVDGADGQDAAKRVKKGGANGNAAAAAAAAASGEVTINGMPIPADWPSLSGEIDLAVQDLPHDSADTEWWYINCHVKSPQGRDFSFFASFFRIVKEYEVEADQFSHVHALSWALIDVENKRYLSDPRVDPATPEILKHQLEKNEYRLDHRLARALYEQVSRGSVPLPDRKIDGAIEVAKDELKLNYGAGSYTFDKDAEGNYLCHCQSPEAGFGFTVKLTPQKKVIRHGHDGVVRIGLKGEDMFYYFIPRCSLEGTVHLDGEDIPVQGQGWYDHEFGGNLQRKKDEALAKHAKKQNGGSSDGPAPMEVDEASPSAGSSSSSSSSSSVPVLKKPAPNAKHHKLEYAWNWAAIQLDNGLDITATTVVSPMQDFKILDNFAVFIHEDSRREEFPDISLQPEDMRISVRTSGEFPNAWDFQVPAANMHLRLEAAFHEQEIVTLISKPSFWEGRLNVTGTWNGQPVKGLAFIERHGFQDTTSMDGFFKRIGKVVRSEIAQVLPMDPTEEDMRVLMASDTRTDLLNGADLEVFRDTVIRPIREIVDRGGKGWRSYACLLCIDAVGGDSNNYKHWLAMPEIMHVGSLIVDDIQDSSETRRGGPTAHKLYGDATAINSGTAAYFIGLTTLLDRTVGLTLEQKLRLYRTYFLTLRAGHAGQAFDINGLDYLMPHAVSSGDITRLLAAVTCTHRLKSAVPAGNLARMGALVGGGSEAQIEGLGNFFESLGVAFQIIDDVLNLRGFKGKTKRRGEDIAEGKITYPVVLAMDAARIPDPAARQTLFEKISAKPQEQEVIETLIGQIESCGALDASVADAERFVNDAWEKLDPLIPDSYYKLNLRAFGWYVLERHY